MRLLALAALTLVTGAGLSHAQSGLPPECITEHAAHAMTTPMDMSMLPPGEAHAALASGMDRMHADMMAGMTSTDIDVAFVCGMIPHHQGAIAMARAVIQFGDDPQTKAFAQKIIDAQEAEIAEMTTWLKAHAAPTEEHSSH